MDAFSYAHRKLVFDRPPPVLRDYADLYLFGKPAGPAPLLVYVGGQIDVKEHAWRFPSEPNGVLDELLVALAHEPIPNLAFLAAPSPPVVRPDFDSHAEDFLAFFEDDLLPALGAQSFSDCAFVGNSYGAYLATYAALRTKSCRALLTFAGVKLLQAAREARPYVPEDLHVEIYRNESDPGAPPSTVIDALRPFPVRVMPPRPGKHAFIDYAANGSVADCFRSALHELKLKTAGRNP